MCCSLVSASLFLYHSHIHRNQRWVTIIAPSRVHTETHAHIKKKNLPHSHIHKDTPPQYCSVQTYKARKSWEELTDGSVSLQAAIKWSIKENMDSVTAGAHKCNLYLSFPVNVIHVSTVKLRFTRQTVVRDRYKSPTACCRLLFPVWLPVSQQPWADALHMQRWWRRVDEREAGIPRLPYTPT